MHISHTRVPGFKCYLHFLPTKLLGKMPRMKQMMSPCWVFCHPAGDLGRVPGTSSTSVSPGCCRYLESVSSTGRLLPHPLSFSFFHSLCLPNKHLKIEFQKSVILNKGLISLIFKRIENAYRIFYHYTSNKFHLIIFCFCYIVKVICILYWKYICQVFLCPN